MVRWCSNATFCFDVSIYFVEMFLHVCLKKCVFSSNRNDNLFKRIENILSHLNVQMGHTSPFETLFSFQNDLKQQICVNSAIIFVFLFFLSCWFFMNWYDVSRTKTNDRNKKVSVKDNRQCHKTYRWVCTNLKVKK